MSFEPILRAATLADAPALRLLMLDLGYPDPGAAMRDNLRSILASSEHMILMADPPEGHAFVHAEVTRTLSSGAQVELVNLAVSAAARRLGLGRALVHAVEAWAVDRGLGAVVVRSNVVRPESHAFYAGLGYTRTKTQHVYRAIPRARDLTPSSYWRGTSG